MKKIVLFSALFVALILTGCSSGKKLVCSQKVSYIEIEVDAEFKENLLNKMWLEEKVDLSSFTSEQRDELANSDVCSEVKKSIPQYGEAFANCKHNLTSNELIVSADIDIDKIYAQTGKTETTYDELKSNYEAQGFTCK